MRSKIFTLSLFMLFAAAYAVSAQRSFGSNFGVSINAGLTGIGATGSVALHKNINARVGFGFLPYTYKYTLDDITYEDYTGEEQTVPPIKLEAQLKVPVTHVLVDYTPFKEGMSAFHITAGLYMGGTKLAHVKGKFDPSLLGNLGDINDIGIEVGDVLLRPNADGSIDAYAKVNSVKPYLGIGWGNAIPRGRVGFRFDIGAMYQGKPTIESSLIKEDIRSDSDVDGIDKILSKVKFWPQLSFQLTFRLLKDK